MKTERTAVVKTEQEIDAAPFEANVIQYNKTTSQFETFKKEKENIVKDLIVIKGENQKLTLQLQQKQREFDNLKRLTQMSTQTLKDNIQGLTNELKNVKLQLEAEKLKQAESTKTIADLIREKNLLSAQLIDMQTAKDQRQSELQESSPNNTHDDETQYEVENIRGHRIYRRQRQFLISWKGYSPSHDSWEKENHLNCPTLLKAYLKDNALSS